MEREHGSVNVSSLLAGAAIGGVVALLYAPKSGSETRRLLKTKAETAREEAQELAEHARRLAEDKAHGLGLSKLERKVRKDKEMDNKTLGIGFLAGTLVGAAIGVLYAPRPGRETRGIIKTKAEHTAEEALHVAEHARDRAVERLERAKSAVASAKKRAEEEQQEEERATS